MPGTCLCFAAASSPASSAPGTCSNIVLRILKPSIDFCRTPCLTALLNNSLAGKPAMLDLTFPVMAVWANAMVFALAGLVNLAGVGTVRQIYSRWDVPAATYRTIGLIEILAAAFLAQPDMRIWG